MAGERKLFGTDGVRGPVGEKLTAELALALGRATAAELDGRAAPGPDHPRHARVRAHARVGARRRHGRGRRRRLPRRRAADARPPRSSSAATASTSPPSSPPRTTPGATTGSSSSTATGRKLDDDAELAGRGPGRRRAGAVRVRRPDPRAATARSTTTCASSTAPSTLDLSGRTDRPRLRQRRHLPRRPRRPSSAAAPTSWRSATSPDGRNINEGCGSTHLENVAEAVSARAPRSASPSTATATACSPSTPTAARSTATRSSRSPRCTCSEVGELPGGAAVTVMTNYGFHQAMDAAGIEVATTKVGDRYVIEELLRARLDDRRRAVGPHHLDRLRRRPATASPPRCW